MTRTPISTRGPPHRSLVWVGLVACLPACGEHLPDAADGREAGEYGELGPSVGASEYREAVQGSDAQAVTAPPNILLITVCSVRADRLGMYGYDRDTSPSMDAFALRSVVFDNAYSNATHTNASHATIFSGLIPGHAGIMDIGEPLSSSVVSLPEVLGIYGYRTAGFVDVESHFGEAAIQGMARGFGEIVYRPLAEMAPSVSIWTERERGPWFAWMHVRLAHLPYGSGLPFNQVRRVEVDQWLKMLAGPLVNGSHDAGNAEMSKIMAANPSVRDDLLARYDSGVRDADQQVGKILDALRAQARTTVQIVASDHGEALGERGHFGHQAVLEPEVLHVPLMMQVPGVVPRRVAIPVALADVMPTILSLVGAVPPAVMDGRSLRAELDGGSLPPRPILAQAVAHGPSEGDLWLREVLIHPPWWLRVEEGAPALFRMDTALGLVPELSPDGGPLEELEGMRAAQSEGTRYSRTRLNIPPELKKVLQLQGYW